MLVAPGHALPTCGRILSPQVFPKDRIRGIYDGSIFYLTEQRLKGKATAGKQH